VKSEVAMKDTDDVKMEINIAGEHLTITVPFSRQDFVRETEKNIAHLYNSWRRQFPMRTNAEVLAMVAYQYASYYRDLLAREDEASTLAAELLDTADGILGND